MLTEITRPCVLTMRSVSVPSFFIGAGVIALTRVGGLAMNDQPERLFESKGEPSAAGSRRRRQAEFVDSLPLVLIVGVALLLMGILHLFGMMIVWPLAPSPPWPLLYGDSTAPLLSERPGIEFALFPLGAIVAAALPGWGARIETLRSKRLAPLLGLGAAGTLVLLVLALGWVWAQGDEWWIGPARLSLAALTAGAGYAGAVLFPRLTATLSGAIAVPAVVGIVILSLPRDLLVELQGGGEPRDLLVALAAAASLALLVLAVIAARYRLWPRLLSHGAWSGAIMILPTAWGILVPYSSH